MCLIKKESEHLQPVPHPETNTVDAPLERLTSPTSCGPGWVEGVLGPLEGTGRDRAFSFL